MTGFNDDVLVHFWNPSRTSTTQNGSKLDAQSQVLLGVEYSSFQNRWFYVNKYASPEGKLYVILNNSPRVIQTSDVSMSRFGWDTRRRRVGTSILIGGIRSRVSNRVRDLLDPITKIQINDRLLTIRTRMNEHLREKFDQGYGKSYSLQKKIQISQINSCRETTSRWKFELTWRVPSAMTTVTSWAWIVHFI